MAKIYVLTSGEYSDYRIEAATTDKKVAKELSETFDFTIGEHNDLTEAIIKPIRGLSIYGAYMHMRNGDSTVEESYNDNWMEALQHEYSIIELNKKKMLSMYVFAKDKTHAAKIASEKRRRLLASGEVKL